jgi:hypothetical protein
MTTKERYRSKSPAVHEVLKAHITRQSVESDARLPEGFDSLPYVKRLQVTQAMLRKRTEEMTNEDIQRYAEEALDWWDAEVAKAATEMDEESLAQGVLEKMRDDDVWSKVIPKFSHTAPSRSETGRLECGIPRIKR